MAVACDAAREDDVARMVAAGAEAFGKIDLLVNNAGDAGPTKPVQDYLDGGLALHHRFVPRPAPICARASSCRRW